MDVSTTCAVVINQVNNQRLILSTDLTKLTLNMKFTTTQVVKTSVTVNNNSIIQGYVHPADRTQPTYETTALSAG